MERVKNCALQYLLEETAEDYQGLEWKETEISD